MIRAALSQLVVIALPKRIKPYFLNLLGHSIHPSAKIGVIVLRKTKLYLGKEEVIANFSIIACRKVILRNQSYIDKFNRIIGPFSLLIKEQGALGRSNVVTRAPYGVVFGPSCLKIGARSKITSSHTIDCTCSVSIGDDTVVAEPRSQIWTTVVITNKNVLKGFV